MKKLLLILLFIVFMAQPVLGALDPSIDNRRTYKNAYRFTGKPKDLFTDWCEAVEDALDGTAGVSFIFFSGLTTAIGEALTDEGTLFYDTDTSVLKYLTGAGWQDIGNTTSGSTLDQAYTAGQGITIDVAAMALSQADTAWSTLTVTSTAGTTNDFDCVVITTASSGYTGDSLYINGIAGSTDIRGDSWNMSQAGVLTLANGDIISNATNDTFLFDTGDEDLKIDFTTGTNTLTLTANSTGATTIDFGDFVTHIGIQSITGEAGADYAIATTNSGTFNLTISQVGTGDNQVIVQSAGSAANAVELISSVAGITLTSADDVTMAITDDLIIVAADDISIDGNSAGSIITIGGNNDGNVIAIGVDDTAADAITIGSVKDTIVIDGVSVTVGDSTGGAATIIQSHTGDITLDSGDDIFLAANTGTGDVISLICTKGTADASIVITSTVGGIDVDAAKAIHLESSEEAGDAVVLYASGTAGGVDITSGTGDVAIVSTDEITLTVNTTTTDNIVLTNTPGTAVDAIEITATVGGIKHTSANVASTWTHTANSAGDDLSFIVAGAFDGSLVLSSTGTLGNAIDIDTSAGGIDIDMAGGSAGEDFSIVTSTSIDFQPSEAQPGQFKVVAGGTNAGDVIELESTDGRIILDANGGDNGDIELNSADDIVITSAGKVTITNTEAVTVSGALTVTGATTTGGFVQVDQVVTDGANYSVTVANSGKIHVIGDLSQNTTIKLPAEADGLNYEFWYTAAAADAADHNITSEDTAAPFIGGVVWVDPANTVATVFSDGVAASPGNYILTIPNMSVGTAVKVTCDGTSWYVTGIVVSDTTPTMTGA